MNTMKKVVVCLGIILMSQNVLAQGSKIGVINTLQALFNSDAAQVVQEGLTNETQADQDRAAELQADLAALQEKFQADQAIMTDEQVRRIQADGQDIQVQMQLISERLQATVNERQQAFLESMREELTTAVTDVVAEGGYDLILNFDSVAYADTLLDITGKVTAKLNENAQRAAQ